MFALIEMGVVSQRIARSTVPGFGRLLRKIGTLLNPDAKKAGPRDLLTKVSCKWAFAAYAANASPRPVRSCGRDLGCFAYDASSAVREETYPVWFR
jgi:hypothetical protein